VDDLRALVTKEGCEAEQERHVDLVPLADEDVTNLRGVELGLELRQVVIDHDDGIEVAAIDIERELDQLPLGATAHQRVDEEDYLFTDFVRLAQNPTPRRPGALRTEPAQQPAGRARAIRGSSPGARAGLNERRP